MCGLRSRKGSISSVVPAASTAPCFGLEEAPHPNAPEDLPFGGRGTATKGKLHGSKAILATLR